VYPLSFGFRLSSRGAYIAVFYRRARLDPASSGFERIRAKDSMRASDVSSGASIKERYPENA